MSRKNTKYENRTWCKSLYKVYLSSFIISNSLYMFYFYFRLSFPNKSPTIIFDFNKSDNFTFTQVIKNFANKFMIFYSVKGFHMKKYQSFLRFLERDKDKLEAAKQKFLEKQSEQQK